MALVADTAPVAFGAIAIPITTLGQVTGLPVHNLEQMVGRQTPLLALIVPFVLVFMVDGRRGLRAAWPAALTAGVVFAVVQFAVSNYVSTELTDIIASLGSAAAVLVLFCASGRPASPRRSRRSRDARPSGDRRRRRPTTPALERRGPRRRAAGRHRRGEMIRAFAPYVIIIVVLGVISLNGIANELDKVTSKFAWPGLHVLSGRARPRAA